MTSKSHVVVSYANITLAWVEALVVVRGVAPKEGEDG
jgi:hypothetical protein